MGEEAYRISGVVINRLQCINAAFHLSKTPIVTMNTSISAVYYGTGTGAHPSSIRRRDQMGQALACEVKGHDRRATRRGGFPSRLIVLRIYLCSLR